MLDSTPTLAGEALLWSRVLVTGTEAEAFLQGQLSQDLASLGEDGAWSLLLTPDSLVIASMHVTRVTGGLSMVVERDLSDVTVGRLRRFLLRTDAQLVVEEIDRGPFATDLDRIMGQWPAASEFARQLTPHTFGSSFVRATISFTKGCFTGQELVGRFDARGSNIPWRFVKVSGDDPQSLDRALCSAGPDGPKGLTSWCISDHKVTGLGVVHRSLLTNLESLQSSGISVVAID